MQPLELGHILFVAYYRYLLRKLEISDPDCLLIAHSPNLSFERYVSIELARVYPSQKLSRIGGHAIELCVGEIESRMFALKSFQQDVLLQFLFLHLIQLLAFVLRGAHPRLSALRFLQVYVQYPVLYHPVTLAFHTSSA
mmetsp:Transcript_29046/g.70858  ORF Transcript_29046/g.70858 Transcript_29046/m.70858 type:complete len:139 (+) Transcript_29046:155-571(+)